MNHLTLYGVKYAEEKRWEDEILGERKEAALFTQKNRIGI